MTYDKKLLARARAELEKDREKNRLLQQARSDEVARRIPELPKLEAAMRAQMSELVSLTLSRTPDLAAKLETLKHDNLTLQMRRAELLTEHGYPLDYLDEIVSCPVCRDSGMNGGTLCVCMKKRYNRELTRELAVLLQNGDECFQNFDLSLYSAFPDAVSGFSPRDIMKTVYAGCRKFADNFPNVSSNLLLRGGTGLGKTYLSACIARTVAEKGYSVCYDTAVSALETFERQKFSRAPETAEAADARVRQMLSCDLMILDDLGTEMTTPMSLSALYTLINTRLTSGLRTVISTNCSDEELEHRYTPQICSRIHGEFLELPFAGSDIRQLRRGQQS
ncbi:MAG: ATP-binding protein [Oscillospiraceae bacterium]|nr:ATP-binding protein [Oscillospiraceae bacterium]